MANTTKYNSFFSEMTIDNNGKPCSDVNVGLKKLYRALNDNWYSFGDMQRYLVAEYEEGHPDLVARNSIMGSQEFWWWFLFLNRLGNPLEDCRENWIYSINSTAQISNFITQTNTVETSTSSVIGTTVKVV